jgi:polysaccharide biosynthesis protein PslH
VAPLRIARGIQNKVLEAMAMARPVVATPQAADGIGGLHGRDYLIASQPADFVNHLVDLVQGDGHHAVGAQARNYVLTGFDWARNLAKLGQILNGTLTLSAENEARCKTAS